MLGDSLMSPADNNPSLSATPLPAVAISSPRHLNGTSTALTHSHAVATLPMPTGLSSGPNLLTLLRALRRRWLLALSLGLLVGAIVAGATWWFLPQPKFIAARKVRILSNPDYVLSNVERAGSGDQFQRSQMA